MSAQASAAVTPDVALKGNSSVFRAGVFSRHFNANKANVGRLGNENDNYIELAPSVTLAEVDGTEWSFTTAFAMVSEDNGAWQSTDDDNLNFANNQVFLRVTGLLDSDKGAALWVGKKYVRSDSHLVDIQWRDVSANGAGIENLSLGSGKLRANWTRRDDSLNFTTKAQGYSAVNAPSRTATNMFDVEYGFAPFDSSWASVGYTLVAPQRYASEYSNYGYKVEKEVGNSHLFTAVLGESLLGGWNNTVVRYVKGSTAGAGLWSHTYTGSKDSSSYNIDIIDFGAVNFTENFNMLYHTWFNFSKVKNSLDNAETHGRDFQLVLRPQYKLTKMTRIMLEAGMFTSSSDTTNFGDKSKTANTQQQKLTLAYGITPDAGNVMSRPEIRFFATYKHFGHNEGRTGTYDHDYTVKDATGTVESLYTGRKTEVYFGAQAEAWF